MTCDDRAACATAASSSTGGMGTRSVEWHRPDSGRMVAWPTCYHIGRHAGIEAHTVGCFSSGLHLSRAAGRLTPTHDRVTVEEDADRPGGSNDHEDSAGHAVRAAPARSPGVPGAPGGRRGGDRPDGAA